MAALNSLSTGQRLALLLSTTALVLTGVVWLALHYSVGAGAGNLPHPFEAWAMRVHGAAAFVGLFVAGLLAAQHIPRGWHMSRPHLRLHRRLRLQRVSGAAMSVLGTLLIATGYVLYYFTPEAWRPAMGWAHTALGGVLVALLPWHAWSHRRLN
jgi:hypothetical protein